MGAAIPSALGKRVILRRSGKIGKRQPTRRELLHEGDEVDNEDDSEQKSGN